MIKIQTNYFARKLFMLGLVGWVLGGGIAFSQAPAKTPPRPPLEPIASEDQDEVIERGIRRRDHRRLPGLMPPKPATPKAQTHTVFLPSVSGPSAGGTFSKGNRYTATTQVLTIAANGPKCCTWS